jgi:hypothetical protein
MRRGYLATEGYTLPPHPMAMQTQARIAWAIRRFDSGRAYSSCHSNPKGPHMTNELDRITAARTTGVALVLDAVRATGKGAHPTRGQRVSDVVTMVAVANNLNPVALQAEVEAYADALDLAARAL